MKMEKITAMTLAAALTAAALAGCGKKEETISLDKNGNFVPDTMLELTVWETQGTDYAPQAVKEGDIVAQWLEEKTLTKVENMYGNDGGQWDTKLTKLVTGDNMPDIIHCGANQGPAHFAKLDEMQQIWELTPEMIQKYAPEVWKRTPAEFWERIKVNGKILGIPYCSPISKEVFPNASDDTIDFMISLYKAYETDVTFLAAQTLWIRDDILKQFYPDAKSYDEICQILNEKKEPIGDELLDIPIKTTDEFVDFMYKIKDANLKSNGKNVYAFGYSGGDNWIALSWLGADMCGYKNHNYTGTWNDEKQQIEIPLVHDIIKQAAKIQNKMINDKVIDPESLAHTTALYKEKILNGQYAIVPLSYAGEPDQINETLKKNGASFRFRPFITQVPNQKEYSPYKEEALWGESLCFTKKLSEKEVCQVLNWINTQYTDEYESVLYWGPEEAGLYTEDANGVRRFKDERFNKYFIDGDADALPNEEDRLGLQGDGGLMKVVACNYSPYDPAVMNRAARFLPRSDSGFKFKGDSEHVKNVKTYPPCQIWSAEYAEIPEVITFWAQREQWESKFKMALASSTDEFDSKWQGAIDDLNKIVDVSAMENKMTEIAKPMADKIGK